MPSLVLALGPLADLPWWWEEVKADPDLCDLTYTRITVGNKRPRQISVLDLPFLFLKVLCVLFRARSRYEYLFTVENDYNSFAVSFWQTVLFLRRPKHVILSFIMRERTRAISSRLKFLLMRFLFASVNRVVCSSRMEIDYYTKVFHWPHSKAGFVPLLTATELLEYNTEDAEGYIFSGGRVYRNYDILLRAVADSSYHTVVVSETEVPGLLGHPNIEPLNQIPLEQFYSLLAKSRIVVLPLEDKSFSVGQTVLLQAMAMGKPVIATRTAGTMDYVDDFATGILVQPNDANGLKEAIDKLMRNEGLRSRLGKNAKDVIRDGHLPHHYTRNVRNLLREEQP
jgi:glycosyltransferase involved in cell wall biosynthesis